MYDCRQSAVSLWIAVKAEPSRGREASRRQPSMTFDVYGNVFEELDGKEPIGLDAVISDARRAA